MMPPTLTLIEARCSTKHERLSPLRAAAASATRPAPASEARLLAHVDGVVARLTARCARPLLLAPRDEAGVRRFLCSALRPSLPLPDLVELYADAGACAAAFASLVDYEPTAEAGSPPADVLSARAALDGGTCDAYDLANLTASVLLGCGYDALIVSGLAPAWMALRDTRTTPCPYLPPPDAVDFAQHVSATALQVGELLHAAPSAGQGAVVAHEVGAAAHGGTEEDAGGEAAAAAASRYAAPPAPMLDSALAACITLGSALKPASVAGAAAPSAPTPSHATSSDSLPARCHAWILLRAGARGVTRPTFVEPTTGATFDADSSPYLAVDYVWNQRNVWVNLRGGDGGGEGGSTAAGSVAGLREVAQSETLPDLLRSPFAAVAALDAAAAESSTRIVRAATRALACLPTVRAPTARVASACSTGESDVTADDVSQLLHAATSAVGVPCVGTAVAVSALGEGAIAAEHALRQGGGSTPQPLPAAGPSPCGSSDVSALRWDLSHADEWEPVLPVVAETAGGGLGTAADAQLWWAEAGPEAAAAREGVAPPASTLLLSPAPHGGSAAAGTPSRSSSAARVRAAAATATAGAAAAAATGTPTELRWPTPASQASLLGRSPEAVPGAATATASGNASSSSVPAAAQQASSSLSSSRNSLASVRSRSLASSRATVGYHGPAGTGAGSEGGSRSVVTASVPFARTRAAAALRGGGSSAGSLEAAAVAARLHVPTPADSGMPLELGPNMRQRLCGRAGERSALYARARLERWALGASASGLVARLTSYADEERTDAVAVTEAFEGRRDGLYKRVRQSVGAAATATAGDAAGGGGGWEVAEHFRRGAKASGLAALVEVLGGRRDMYFYAGARIDGLRKREHLLGRKVREWFGPAEGGEEWGAAVATLAAGASGKRGSADGPAGDSALLQPLAALSAPSPQQQLPMGAQLPQRGTPRVWYRAISLLPAKAEVPASGTCAAVRASEGEEGDAGVLSPAVLSAGAAAAAAAAADMQTASHSGTPVGALRAPAPREGCPAHIVIELSPERSVRVHTMKERLTLPPPPAHGAAGLSAPPDEFIDSILYNLDAGSIRVRYHPVPGGVLRCVHRFRKGTPPECAEELSRGEEGGGDGGAPRAACGCGCGERGPCAARLAAAWSALLRCERECHSSARVAGKAAHELLAVRRGEAGAGVGASATEAGLYELARARARAGEPLERDSDGEVAGGGGGGSEGAGGPPRDLLAPFILATHVALPADGRFGEKEARRLDKECRAAHKERLLARVAAVQRALDEESEALLQRQQAFARSREHDREAELEFERACADAQFRIGILEARLARQEATATRRYQELEAALVADPRLAALRPAPLPPPVLTRQGSVKGSTRLLVPPRR